jgi:hypothetical protein
VLLPAALVLAIAAPAHAIDLRIATENDFLTRDNRDDLYTFSLALAVERGPYTFSLRENAFTDRQAGARFDETQLAVRRAIPGFEAWSLHTEAGAVHVGRGLFGQDAQNALHRLVGGDELDLRYLGSRVYPSLGLEAERSFAVTGDLSLGPRLEVVSVPGFRSHAALGARADWRASASITLHAFAGGRWSDSSLALLDRHLASLAPLARLGVVLKDRVFVSWTYNDYGDEREHLSIGLRITGRATKGGAEGHPRRSGSRP